MKGQLLGGHGHPPAPGVTLRTSPAAPGSPGQGQPWGASSQERWEGREGSWDTPPPPKVLQGSFLLQSLGWVLKGNTVAGAGEGKAQHPDLGVLAHSPPG